MAGSTKVGPAEPGDFPRKRGLVDRILRFLYVASGLAWVARVFWYLPMGSAGRAIDAVNKDDEPGFHYHPPPGIREAELTDAEREAAAERMSREDAIRRARGEM